MPMKAAVKLAGCSGEVKNVWITEQRLVGRRGIYSYPDVVIADLQ